VTAAELSEASDAPPTVAKKSNFYLAMRILEPARRDAMYAIYGFCRAVDDIADDEGDPAERRAGLNAWRKAIADLYRGRVDPLCAALAEPRQRFGLERADFEAVIDGMQMDVDEDIRAPDWAKLDLYCDRVASAVGRLSLRAFGYVPASTPAGALSEDASALAHHLGRALQLTNILRDLDEDCARGRLYLPREALQAAGITDFDPASALAHPALGQVCAEVAARAREHFDVSWKIIAKGPGRNVKAPALMAAAYGSILDRLLARGFAAPRPRVSASKGRVLLALARYAFA
jgi:presqualene diphosphate synthase